MSYIQYDLKKKYLLRSNWGDQKESIRINLDTDGHQHLGMWEAAPTALWDSVCSSLLGVRSVFSVC